MSVSDTVGFQDAEILKGNDTAAVKRALEGHTSINLNNKGIGNKGAKILANALEGNDTIAYIELHNNNICVEGGHALANLLERNDTIIYLGIDGGNNGISDKDSKAIKAATVAGNNTFYLLCFLFVGGIIKMMPSPWDVAYWKGLGSLTVVVSVAAFAWTD